MGGSTKLFGRGRIVDRSRAVTVLAALFLVVGVSRAQGPSKEAVERNSIGARLLKEGKTEKAVEELKTAIGLSPDYAPARLNLAYAYSRLGWIDDAINEYRRAIELEPENLLAHNNLGVLYDKQGHYDEAIGEFRQALRIDPKNGSTLENLARSEKNKAAVEERQARIAQAEKEAQAQPDSPRCSYNLARTYAFYGKKDEAMEWLDKAFKLGFSDIGYLKADPVFEGFKDDPRFVTLLRSR